MTTTLPILRRSAMQAAKHCLFRFDKVYNRGVPDMSDYALRGIAFHACVHSYIQRLVAANVEQDEEESRAAFAEGIARSLTPGHLIGEVRELFDRWAESFQLELHHFVTAEERHAHDDRMFTPDLVYAKPNELEVIDWKTYWQPLTEEQVRQDFQARWYARAASAVWKNFPIYRITFAFVRFNKFVSVTFKPSELDALDREVAATLGTIQEAQRTNHWPATPGEDCRFCQLDCPIVDNPMLVPKRFPSLEFAQLVAAWTLATEQRVKLAKAALKAYVASHGPLTVGTLQYDNRPTVSKSFPAQPVVDALHRVSVVGGLDPTPDDGELTFSASALKGLFKRFPALQTELEPLATEKTSYRFSAKKAGESADDEE